MSEPRARVEALVAGARRLADPSDPLGIEARDVLPASTGLSLEGIELALSCCLETRPTSPHLDDLVASVEPAPRSWVLLSANVVTAPLRAVALALAASRDVRVRASRREPHFVRLLHRAAAVPFALVDALEPEAQDQVFAYGREETLVEVASRLPTGVRFVGHGPGMGVAAVRPDASSDADLADLADRLAFDVCAFDQRGCLSPRLVIAEGTPAGVERLACAIADALARWEARVPGGAVTDSEAAEIARYRQTTAFLGRVEVAGKGLVGCVTSEAAGLVVPPPGRVVHVVRAGDAGSMLESMRSRITALGVDEAPWREALARRVPGARLSTIGEMQRPPLDGPVDRRGAPPDLWGRT